MNGRSDAGAFEPRKLMGCSRLGFTGLLPRINELADFRPLPLEIGKVLFPELLVDLEFLLRFIYFLQADIRLRVFAAASP